MLRHVVAIAASMSVFALACGPGASDGALRAGRSVYADHCSSCHGSRGQGGVGPALDHVVETWPSCADHQDWIALGSQRWQAERGPTYGADDTPITNIMPSHADKLSPEEIASVAAFERVEYGGSAAAAELDACGLGGDG